MDITPEDFTGRVAGHVTADDKFDRFVETCQFATRAIFVNRGYELQYPMIALADEHHVWFMPSRPGLLEDLLDAVREEAQERGATWFFVAVPTLVGWDHVTGDERSDVDTPDDGTHEQLEPGIYWHAASKVGSYYRRRAGLSRFTESDLSPFRDLPADQPTEMFDKVLA